MTLAPGLGRVRPPDLADDEVGGHSAKQRHREAEAPAKVQQGSMVCVGAS